MLKGLVPQLEVSSAGLAAMVGHPADAGASAAAAEVGLDLDGHVARQMTAALGAAHDLILVMEQSHRAEIASTWPQLGGRTMLFDRWTGGRDIADPYRKPAEFHRQTRDRIATAAEAWARHLMRAV